MSSSTTKGGFEVSKRVVVARKSLETVMERVDNHHKKINSLEENVNVARNNYFLLKDTMNNHVKLLNSLTENVNYAQKELEGAKMSLMVADEWYKAEADKRYDVIDNCEDILLDEAEKLAKRVVAARKSLKMLMYTRDNHQKKIISLKANIKAARNTYYLAKESRNNQEKMLNSLTENVNDARKELEWTEMSLMEAETSYENFDIIDDNMDDTSSEKHATTLVGYCVGPWIQLGYCRM
jgi:chromosome segregation ATPase